MKDKSVNKLLSHTFTIEVMKQFNPHLDSLQETFLQNIKKSENSGKSKKGNKPTSKPSLSSEQAYHAEVFQNLSNLIRAIERVEEITVYLGQFPNSKSFAKQGITQDKWIHYHYANYYVTMVGIYDTVLLLINAVLFLGLKPFDCKDSTVTENRRVKSTPVAESIKKLQTFIKDFKSPRHLYVHRSQLPDMGFLERLESYRFIQETSKELGIEEEPLMHPIIIKDLYRLERRNFVKTTRSDINGITSILAEIFNALKIYYVLYSEQFRSK